MSENMKFKFKIQPFQTDAVQSVIDVFTGQPKEGAVLYRIDPGKETPPEPEPEPVSKTQFFEGFEEDVEEEKQEPEEAPITTPQFEEIEIYRKAIDSDGEVGFGNPEICLDEAALLANIQKVQGESNLPLSKKLSTSQPSQNYLKEYPLPPPCHCSLDIEMETGTGKTYVYTKTIFELNKRYGWSKFIIVVPSVAIREGVKKSFDLTEEHFQAQYQQKARVFIYNSKNLSRVEEFSSSDKIQVMIINMQAFNARGEDARKIYEELDSFGTRRPIDVIAANRPILILDEPQKMGGEKTQDSLHHFHPLFMLNYSATHKNQHDLIYALDAVDAYNQRLVKKIEVKGFEQQNVPGTTTYLYLDRIIVSKQAPVARVEFQVQSASGEIKRQTKDLLFGDDLFFLSKQLNAYQNCKVTEIDPIQNRVEFSNGITLTAGEAYGDLTEEALRRIQIRETIRSHFEKEEKLFDQGIKTLSLFFIDEVSHYRQYDDEGNEKLGEYGRIFEEEYQTILGEYVTLFPEPYQKYLQSIDFRKTHTGYFSIDKKGRSINSTTKRGSDESDDISAYDLILKNKERLLKFDEPVRFIFSHSALREGWDNPNVFQICTLKHSGQSNIQKRQEVGRGLRLCVNQNGERMDTETLGMESVFDLNRLTVITSEGYADFVKGLQADMKEDLCERTLLISTDYFCGKTILVNGQPKTLSVNEAGKIFSYLDKNNYIDARGKILPKYQEDLANHTLAPLPQDLVAMEEGIRQLITPIIEGKTTLDEMIDNGKAVQVADFDLNANFDKAEFQALWKQINDQYSYRVDFDSQELIDHAVETIDKTLAVKEFRYTIEKGEQTETLDRNAVENQQSFQKTASREEYSSQSPLNSSTKYDLIKEIVDRTHLTRRTVATILAKIHPEKFQLYSRNPEGFIAGVSKIINEQKATMVVEHIVYQPTGAHYDKDIFTVKKSSRTFANAKKVTKNVQNYLFTDGMSDDSIESRFADSLEGANEVIVYAKLPRGFQIPTPMGNYAPDWAIVFDQKSVKHIFFVAETKGSLDSTELRGTEKGKIECVKKLFQQAMKQGKNVRYDTVKDFKTLMDIVGRSDSTVSDSKN